jgi:type II secretory pathway pseudopilin PulG
MSTFASRSKRSIISNHHRTSVSERCAYSILELMIALSLLSVLLLLGWSLMQSIQDAETRSWKLTQRIRVLRTTRAWLADDMDHLVRSEPSNRSSNFSSATSNLSKNSRTTASIHSNPPNQVSGISSTSVEKFEGDSTGFLATISPSLDPIRFFDRALNSSDPTDIRSQELSSRDTLLASETELAVLEARESLWPEQRLDIEYRLEPVNRDQEVSSTAILETQDLQFELVRREWLPSQADTNNHTTTNPPPSADRELTSADLYRGVEPSDETYAPPIKETRLYGMVQAEFFYFDGSSWSQEWSSLDRGGVPKAVAICFDFPARADFIRPEISSEDLSADGGSTNDLTGGDFLDSFERQQTTVLDPASQDTTLGSDKDRLVESSEREVVIIVETGNRMGSLSPSSSAGVFAR